MTQRTPPPSLPARRFRSYRSRTRPDTTEASVTLVSAPPRVMGTTTTTTARTTPEQDEEITTTSTETSTSVDLWSASAPPKITARNNSVARPGEDEPSSSDSEIEWVFFEAPRPSEKSQPLKVLTFETESDNGTGRMEQYFDATEDISVLTLTVSIIILVLCLGNTRVRVQC